MISVHWVLGAIVAATAVSASADETELFAHLLRRQEPGTPAYNCHDNCGQAIIQGRSSADVCNDEIFLTDYENCLQCSGPDNEDIWKYYSSSLTQSASQCGLSTEPLTGDQPDVGPALPATTGATQSTQSTSSAQDSSASSTTEAPTTSTAEEGSSGSSEATTSADTAKTGSGYATATPTSATTGASPTSVSATLTQAPTGTGNGTVPTTTSEIPVVNNAARGLAGSFVGVYGVLALGAVCAVVQ